MKYILLILLVSIIKFEFAYCNDFRGDLLKFNISTNVNSLSVGDHLIVTLDIENKTGEDLFFAHSRLEKNFIVSFLGSNSNQLRWFTNTIFARFPTKTIDDFLFVPNNTMKTVQYKFILLKRKQWLNDLQLNYDGLYLFDEPMGAYYILLYKEREIKIQCEWEISADTIEYFDKVLQGKKQFEQKVSSNIIKIKIAEP